jgi:transposase
MLLKTVLNKIEKFSSFVYKKVEMTRKGEIVVTMASRKNSKGRCPVCKKKRPTYDTSKDRRLYSYVPLWGMAVYFSYKLRRVSCKRHGILTEYVPWARGKERYTMTYKIFLASWARRLSWQETARVFGTSWDTVFNCIKWVVDYGLETRVLKGIATIGIDEIQVFKGHKYLTMVYQLDAGIKRLLWCGKDRTENTLRTFFTYLGERGSSEIKYICTDMWKPYMQVIKERAPQAINVLDRFHIMKKFNEAIDEIRRGESNGSKKQKEKLTHSRWVLLKNEENLTEHQVEKLNELLKSKLKSIKAYLLRNDFQKFWGYIRRSAAEKFLKSWCKRTRRTRIEPMKKVGKMLESKKELILNWFTIEPRLSSGAVEAMNNKAKLTMRKAYGFRTEKHLKYALYHTMGDLPWPKTTHRFNC